MPRFAIYNMNEIRMGIALIVFMMHKNARWSGIRSGAVNHLPSVIYARNKTSSIVSPVTS